MTTFSISTLFFLLKCKFSSVMNINNQYFNVYFVFGHLVTLKKLANNVDRVSSSWGGVSAHNFLTRNG